MYWGSDDPPMYYTDGRPANDTARWEGPPDWAPDHIKEEHEAIEYAKELYRQSRRGKRDDS